MLEIYWRIPSKMNFEKNPVTKILKKLHILFLFRSLFMIAAIIISTKSIIKSMYLLRSLCQRHRLSSISFSPTTQVWTECISQLKGTEAHSRIQTRRLCSHQISVPTRKRTNFICYPYHLTIKWINHLAKLIWKTLTIVVKKISSDFIGEYWVLISLQ